MYVANVLLPKEGKYLSVLNIYPYEFLLPTLKCEEKKY